MAAMTISYENACALLTLTWYGVISTNTKNLPDESFTCNTDIYCLCVPELFLCDHVWLYIMWQLRYALFNYVVWEWNDDLTVHVEETSECTLLAIGFQLVMITTGCIMMECVCVGGGGGGGGGRHVLAGSPLSH